MNQLKTTDLGGFRFRLNDLRWVASGINEASKGMLSLFPVTDSSTFIISGCETVGGAINAGYVSIGGEVCYFPGAGITPINSYWVIQSSFDSEGTKTFKNSSVFDTYEIRIATLSSFFGSPPAGFTALLETKRIEQLIREKINNSPWVNIGSAGTDFSAQVAKCTKDVDGFVRMKGQSIFEDDSSTPSKLIGLLPSGFRPLEETQFYTCLSIGGTIVMKKGTILTNGEIRIFNTNAGTLEVNLSDLPNFRVS